MPLLFKRKVKYKKEKYTKGKKCTKDNKKESYPASGRFKSMDPWTGSGLEIWSRKWLDGRISSLRLSIDSGLRKYGFLS